MSQTAASKRGQAPLWLLLLIAFTGTLAMHVFVPALPIAQQALATSTQHIQLTITVYVIGLAVGQLIYGPISDAIGRRPAVFAGLTIYFVGSLAALMAPSLPTLVAARFLQALGGAGGLSLARVMVRDASGEAEATKNLALLNLILLIGPGVAPIIGSLLSTTMGWRSIFGVLAALGGITILLAVRKLPETTFPSGNLAPSLMIRDFLHVITNRRFALITLGGCLASTGSYAYFASAPYILHGQLAVPLSHVGFYVSFTLVGASIGTLSARFLVGRVKLSSLIRIAGSIAVVNALVFLVIAWSHLLSPTWVLLLTFIQLVCAGTISPLSLGTALGVIPKMAGSASGVYGFCQMMVGAICTFLVGLGSNPAVACGFVMLGAYGLSFLLLWRGRLNT